MLKTLQQARHEANEKEERQNMLGLFKRMLSKQEAPQPAPPVQATLAAKPVATPPIARVAVPAPVRVRVASTVLKPAQPSVHLRSVAQPSATSTHVRVALAAIAASLPESISHKVPANPEQFVPIPVDKVLPQLSRGQIVMTAAELREYAPDFFTALADHDDIALTLPLGDIIKQLSLEHFVRRDQRRVEVPAEVMPVFAAGSNSVSVAKPASPQSTPVQRVQPTITTTTPLPAPAPIQTSAGKIAMSSQGLASLSGKSSTPASVPSPRFTSAAASPATAVSRNPAPLPTLPKKKPLPTAAKISGELAVPLASVCHQWIDEVRAQLVDVDVAQSKILVPLELLEPTMKSGKVLFSWQEVAGWIQPPLAIPPTPKVGEMTVELSLKVIAPLFMAHHRGAIQKRLTVDETIPDMFAGGNGNANSSVQAQIASAPQALVAPAPLAPPTRSSVPSVPLSPALRMAPALPAKPESEVATTPVVTTPAPRVQSEVSIEQIIGSATSRLGAKEIVANTSRLSGIAGALLAMSDGLLVTSQMPPQLKAETIAAFLPQMFGRMNQYTKELALGPLERLALRVESGEWHVFKCPDIYFAVLGKHGEALPLNLLAQVAAELSSQSK
jgi:predicted regulator of Ras-like GTPase activity (Roadblock/LC7/MglB family)